MRNRCDRRGFIKLMGGAAVAPYMTRAADAMTFSFGSALGPPPDKLVLASNPLPNLPVGVGKGLHPGRVAWAHDANATPWQGPGQGHWWESDHTNQSVVDKMMSGAGKIAREQ